MQTKEKKNKREKRMMENCVEEEKKNQFQLLIIYSLCYALIQALMAIY